MAVLCGPRTLARGSSCGCRLVQVRRQGLTCPAYAISSSGRAEGVEEPLPDAAALRALQQQSLLEYEALKEQMRKTSILFGSLLSAYLFLTVSSEAGVCCAIGAVAGHGYLRLLQRDVDALTAEDEVPYVAAEEVRTQPWRALALGFAAYRQALKPRLLVPVALVAAAAVFSAKAEQPLSLTQDGFLLLGFLTYKMSLIQQIWDTFKPKLTAPTATDKLKAARPVLAEVEDIDDIIAKIEKIDGTPKGNKANPPRERWREVQIAAEVSEGDVNLISVYEAILTPTHLALVMEYAEGGSLVQHVAERWQYAEARGLVLNEDETRYLFRQFISAVAYCHRHGVAHRDLKLDNTLLHNSPPTLKICDFGFATSFKQRLERMTSHIGTPEYMSPELLHNGKEEVRKPYDPRTVDVWASGVMMVVALLGAFPFDPSRHHHTDLHDAEVDLWLQEVSQSWSESPYIADNVDKLSPECRDLLDKIFTVDAEKRVTVEQIMQHPWYTKPLLPDYQAALEAQQKEQQGLEKKHTAQPLDLDLVDKRNEAIRMLVDMATKPGIGTGNGKGRFAQLRPLHMLDVKGQSLQSVSLRREAVVVGAPADQITTLTLPEGPLGPHTIPSHSQLYPVQEAEGGGATENGTRI
ncbi:hypothetical protein WJX72_009377 [[Myrmecia] bisecta]|uniref:non-specific serine/threonine protein kinase n=1 Tax=[Myrmecia] bisecta TaxID=41462 RepID=A0AAW1PJR3_9CHLO